MRLCKCSCGNLSKVRAQSLINGSTKSCCCFLSERTIERNTKHNQNVNLKPTKTYKTWINMISRCYNPKASHYKDYGGRGIQVCAAWRESFITFYQDMGEKPDGLQIDRIDNNGNYEPSNCRWTTSKENNNNKRPRSKC